MSDRCLEWVRGTPVPNLLGVHEARPCHRPATRECCECLTPLCPDHALEDEVGIHRCPEHFYQYLQISGTRITLEG